MTHPVALVNARVSRRTHAVDRIHRPIHAIGRTPNVSLLTTQVLSLPNIFVLLGQLALTQTHSLHVLRQSTFLARRQCRCRPPQEGTSLKHLTLHIDQELMLRAEDASGPTYLIPPDESPRWKLVMLHRVEPNECPGPA